MSTKDTTDTKDWRQQPQPLRARRVHRDLAAGGRRSPRTSLRLWSESIHCRPAEFSPGPL